MSADSDGIFRPSSSVAARGHLLSPADCGVLLDAPTAYK